MSPAKKSLLIKIKTIGATPNYPSKMASLGLDCDLQTRWCHDFDPRINLDCRTGDMIEDTITVRWVRLTYESARGQMSEKRSLMVPAAKVRMDSSCIARYF